MEPSVLQTFNVEVPRRGFGKKKSAPIKIKMQCVDEQTACAAAALLVDFIEGRLHRYTPSPDAKTEDVAHWAAQLVSEQFERKFGAVYQWATNRRSFGDEQQERLRFLLRCYYDNNLATLRLFLCWFSNPTGTIPAIMAEGRNFSDGEDDCYFGDGYYSDGCYYEYYEDDCDDYYEDYDEDDEGEGEHEDDNGNGDGAGSESERASDSASDSGSDSGSEGDSESGDDFSNFGLRTQMQRFTTAPTAVKQTSRAKPVHIPMNRHWTQAEHPFVFYSGQVDLTSFRLNKLGWCLLHWKVETEQDIDAYCAETIVKVCRDHSMDDRNMNAFYSKETADWTKFFHNQLPWVLRALADDVKHGMEQKMTFELDIRQLLKADDNLQDARATKAVQAGGNGGSSEFFLKHLVIPDGKLPAEIVDNIGCMQLLVELRREFASGIVQCTGVLSEREMIDPITGDPWTEWHLNLAETGWQKLRHPPATWLASCSDADEQSKVICTAIMGLTPCLRYVTICTAPPVSNALLPKVVACEASEWIFDGDNLAALPEFHPAQLGTIVDEKLQNHPKGEIMFVEAPPGTGKTTVACELLHIARRQRRRIMGCTYSVEALCVLTEKFLEQLPADESRNLRIVVAASLHNKRLNHTFERFALDRRKLAWTAIERVRTNLRYLVQRSAEGLSWLTQRNADVLQDCDESSKLIRQAVDVATSIEFTNWDPTLPTALNAVKVAAARVQNGFFSMIVQKKISKASENKARQAVDELRQKERELNQVLQRCAWYEDDQSLLSFADVVFATLLVTGRRGFAGMRPPELLVIDEAAQATQLATMLALCTNPRLAVFLGDTRQLEPFVSEAEEDAGFGCSSMHRYRKQLGEQSWNELAVMMRVQHRMHPTICDMVSTTFYEEKLLSAHGLEHTRTVHPHLQKLIKPLCFVDIRGVEQQAVPGTSRFNEEEVELCVKIVEYLRRNGISTDEIGVVAAYAAQTRLLEKRLGAEGLSIDVKVGSIDSFQGREKDYIVLTCVRAQRKIGFLRVPNRINVAVTRARRAVIMVGHARTLQSYEDAKIREVLDYCQLRTPHICGYVTAQQIEQEIAAGNAGGGKPNKKNGKQPQQKNGKKSHKPGEQPQQQPGKQPQQQPGKSQQKPGKQSKKNGKQPQQKPAGVDPEEKRP